jgi:simple sugar transport system permease protein
MLAFLGKNPFQILSLLISEVFGSGYGFGQTLFKTTPLIILGCALALCFHASIFNIGAEGQLNAGAFTMGVLAAQMQGISIWVALPLIIAGGFIVSGLFGLIPALIKVKKGVSEVITTIMLNFIVLALVNYLLLGFFGVESTMHTVKIPDALMLPALSEFIPAFEGSSVNIVFILSILIAAALYIFIYKTRTGYRIRAIGLNETASKYIGIKINRYIVWVFVIGAGITSIAGLNYISGYKGYYEFGFSNNIGFTAIAVALLAKNNPVGVIFSAFLFGVLDYGGLSINQEVPKELMLVVQALIILSIIAADKMIEMHYENLSGKISMKMFSGKAALKEEP